MILNDIIYIYYFLGIHALHWISLHCYTVHYKTLQYNTLHCNALHYIPSRKHIIYVHIYIYIFVFRYNTYIYIYTYCNIYIYILAHICAVLMNSCRNLKAMETEGYVQVAGEARVDPWPAASGTSSAEAAGSSGGVEHLWADYIGVSTNGIPGYPKMVRLSYKIPLKGLTM